MAKRKSLEDTLKHLSTLRADPHAEDSIRDLREVLATKNAFTVAKAAEIAGEFEIGAVVNELVVAFDRFMTEIEDKNCTAKIEIADALYSIAHDDAGVFLRGIRHVQREPVYNGYVDAAAPLRGMCALGLVRMQYPDVLTELADLLADPEARTREAAVQAMGYWGSDAVVPLLRYKALTGDPEPEVMTECFTAILQISPSPGVRFVSKFLDGSDLSPTPELAAVALGTSREEDAFEILRDWWQRQPSASRRRTGLVAIGMLRRQDGFDFLLELVGKGDTLAAHDAVDSLEPYLDDDKIRIPLRQAIEARSDLEIDASVTARIANE